MFGIVPWEAGTLRPLSLHDQSTLGKLAQQASVHITDTTIILNTQSQVGCTIDSITKIHTSNL